MRAGIALCVLAVTACGSAPLQAARAGDYVPWVPLPAAHQSVDDSALVEAPQPVPAGASECGAGQLEGVGLASGIAAGNVDRPLLFRNKSTTGCYVRGFVDVAVLDRAGRVLARAAGASGRGTFFADGPVTEVWMPAGTRPLPRPFATRDGHGGQALMNFSWYDCATPLAAALELGLPDARGTLRMPYETRAAINPYCQGPGASYRSISRGPLSPAGSLWPFFDVEVKMSAPTAAKHGSSVTYYVTLTNRSDSAFDMRPCADYAQYVGKSRVVSTFQLNCAPVGQLAAGSSATFEMNVDVPAAAQRGASELIWCLNDGRIDPACDVVDIAIT